MRYIKEIILLCLHALLGCSSQASQLASSNTDTASVETLYQTLQAHATGFDRSALQAFRATSPTLRFRQALLAASDAPLSFGGAELTGMKAYLTSHRATTEAALAAYPTYGALLDQQHVNLVGAKITRTDVQDLLTTLASALDGRRAGASSPSSGGLALNPYDDAFLGLNCQQALVKNANCAKFVPGQCNQDSDANCNDGDGHFTVTLIQAVAACHSAYGRVLGDANRHCGPTGDLQGPSGDLHINVCSNATCTNSYLTE